MSTTLENVETHEIGLEDREGRPYVGRITGVLLVDDGDCSVYLTSDRRVILYDERRQRFDVLDDPEEDLQGMEPGAYTTVMDALGIKAVIDL